MSATTRMAYSVSTSRSCVESNAGSLAEARALVRRIPRDVEVTIVRYDRSMRTPYREVVWAGRGGGA